MKKLLNTKVLACVFLFLVSLLSTESLNAQVEYEQSLAGSEKGSGFILTWSTHSETNNQFFVIERSIDGSKFKPVGNVKSKNLAEKVMSYQFQDIELGLKNVTYRLKQVSSDGSSSYSDAIVLKKQFVNYFEVVKNEKISDEVFQVSVNSVKDGELECRLANNMGDIIIEELKPMQVGLNDYVFDLTSEMDGIYHLVLKLKNVMETVTLKKITKNKKTNVAKKKSTTSGG